MHYWGEPEPHINRLYGAGCYGTYIVRTLIRQFWPPRFQGPHLFAPIHITRVWLEAKIVAACECFELSQQSTSNNHYIALQPLAAPCRHSFSTCNAQLGSPHNAVHCLVCYTYVRTYLEEMLYAMKLSIGEQDA